MLLHPTALTSFWLRFVLDLTLIIIVAVLVCLLTGVLLPGESIAAFTANPVRTRDVWVMDINRHIFQRMDVFGHEDEVPVWSVQERWLVYYPRTK